MLHHLGHHIDPFRTHTELRQALGSDFGPLFGVAEEPGSPRRVLGRSLRFGDVMEQRGQFQHRAPGVPVRGLLIEICLAIRGPRHAGIDG